MLEPEALAVRGKGANGLSARGAAAGRGFVGAAGVLPVAAALVAGFVVFGAGLVTGFEVVVRSGTPLA
jgi:hypothetical protein